MSDQNELVQSPPSLMFARPAPRKVLHSRDPSELRRVLEHYFNSEFIDSKGQHQEHVAGFSAYSTASHQMKVIIDAVVKDSRTPLHPQDLYDIIEKYTRSNIFIVKPMWSGYTDVEWSTVRMTFLLFKMFQYAPLTTQDIVVHRGGPCSSKEGQYRFEGFISTTNDFSVTEIYLQKVLGATERCVYSITVPKGVPVLYILDLSVYPTEREVLLLPGVISVVSSKIVETPDKHYPMYTHVEATYTPSRMSFL